jgi:hypothetical protein
MMMALMKKAASTCETSVNIYQSTQLYNPKDSQLHTHRRENLKYHEICITLSIPYRGTKL